MSNGKTICTVCNYIYDEALGEASQHTSPSSKFDDLPDEWRCPECGSSKEMFQPCSCVSLHIYEQTCVRPGHSWEGQPLMSALAAIPLGQLVAERPER